MASTDDYIACLERVERASRFAQRPLVEGPALPSVREYLLRDIHAHREAAR